MVQVTEATIQVSETTMPPLSVLPMTKTTTMTSDLGTPPNGINVTFVIIILTGLGFAKRMQAIGCMPLRMD